MIKDIEKTLVTYWDQAALSDFSAETYRYADIAELILQMHNIYNKAGI